MTTAAFNFDECFTALTGHPPLRWQCRLYAEHFVSGDIPASCTLPTGLGKTSVIPIWLIALANTLLANSAKSDTQAVKLPRRLIYIVNRRTIVDQATEVVERIREKLNSRDANGAVRGMQEALRTTCVDSAGEVLAVSTLRGELADNGEWKKDPARPAIVIGTIDMIGSKLLFSGYGDGRYNRAHHAGLVGQDTLIIHDEAHLSPAFSSLLRSIEEEQRTARKRNEDAEPRPIRVMELSATSRKSNDDAATPHEDLFGIEDEDKSDPVVVQRLHAAKHLTLAFCETGKGELARVVADKALSYRNQRARVLVFVRSPEDAKGVIARIKDKKTGLGEDAESRVCLLTGTLRGFERDRMANENRVFREFLSKTEWKSAEQTVWLVSTSAGEVGVDLDADHLVCDLTTLDSMAQRFGRVNRLGGEGRFAEITAFCEKPKTDAENKKQKEQSPFDKAVTAAGKILKSIEAVGGDVSSAALRPTLESDDAKVAFSPTPTILPATDILFDNWSLTSLGGELPGRPQVGDYLHGVPDWDPPETYVAWRSEVSELAKAHVSEEDLREILQAHPIKSWERLRETLQFERSTKKWVLAKLPQLAQRELEGSKIPVGDLPAIVVDADGSAMLTTIREAAGMGLRDRTVVLPVEAGGLSSNGILSPSDKEPSVKEPARDVADERPQSSRQSGNAIAGSAASSDTSDQHRRPRAARLRVMFRRTDDGWTAAYIGRPSDTDATELPAEPLADRAELIDKISKASGLPLKYTVQIGGSEDEEPHRFLLYFVSQRDPDAPPDFVAARQSLNDHKETVVSAAQRLADKMGLDKDTKQALVIAARHHDDGKMRERWQKMVGGSLAEPLAKSGNRFVRGADLSGYRHEFGSVQDAMADSEVKQAADGVRELALHLIAAHHGWARPHFPHDDPLQPRSRGRWARSAYDNERYTTAQNQAAAIEVTQRFGRLQQRFGRWGLAWLESLLRSADAMASQPEQSRHRQGVDANIAPQSPQEDRP